MIAPTIGRIVWYYPHGYAADQQPQAAQIAYVHSASLVNLGVLSAQGSHYPVTSVKLVQEDEDVPGRREQFCTWMPYQNAQAKAAA